MNVRMPPDYLSEGLRLPEGCLKGAVEPCIVATCRHQLGNYLRAALTLGLQVRRCEETGRGPAGRTARPTWVFLVFDPIRCAGRENPKFRLT